MNVQDLIRYYGTQQKAAEAIGLSQPTISGWIKTGIPFYRQCQIQVVTKGKLKAAQ